MPKPYPAFPADGIRLLRQLERNNSTDWFRKHKSEYDALVKHPFIELVGHINEALEALAPAYRVPLPKGISRPNRDTRFSKDKSPYRTDISAIFPRNGKEKHESAGFFLRVSAAGAYILGGVYMPGPEELRRLRAYIAKNHQALTAIVRTASKKVGVLCGEQLQKAPRDYASDHPAADYLRKTQLYFEQSLAASITTSPRLVTDVVAGFKAMTPLVEYLDKGLGNLRSDSK